MPPNVNPTEGADRTESAIRPSVQVSEAETAELSLQEGVIWLRGRWKWIAGSAVVGALVFMATALLTPTTYTATATFLPFEGPTQESGLGEGLPGALFALTGNRSATSLYIELVEARTVLREVAAARYTVREEGEAVTATLVDLWGGSQALEREPHQGRTELAMKRTVRSLRNAVEASGDASGLVTLEVVATRPELAEQIASRLVEEVDEWNRERRRTQAATERDYLEESVADVRQQLDEAEHELQVWLEGNVRFESSPQKTFEYQRLQRRVDLQSALYHSLAQTLENVKLQAVRARPAIAVLDRAESEIEANERPILSRSLLGLVFGAGVGFIIALLSERTRGTLKRLRRT